MEQSTNNWRVLVHWSYENLGGGCSLEQSTTKGKVNETYTDNESL